MAEQMVVSLAEVDRSLPEIKAGCDRVLAIGKTLEVSSATKPETGEVLVALKTTLDALEKKRKEYVDDPTAFVTAVNARFRPLRDPLDQLDKDLRKRLGKVIQDEEDAARRERERILNEQRRQDQEAKRLENERLAAEKALREAETLGQHGEAVAKVQEVTAQQQALAAQPPPARVPLPAGPARRTRLEQGAVGHTMEWTFGVQNLAEVPREYLLLDEAKVRAYIGVGGRKIPGLWIGEKPVIRVEKGR